MQSGSFRFIFLFFTCAHTFHQHAFYITWPRTMGTFYFMKFLYQTPIGIVSVSSRLRLIICALPKKECSPQYIPDFVMQTALNVGMLCSHCFKVHSHMRGAEHDPSNRNVYVNTCLHTIQRHRIPVVCTRLRNENLRNSKRYSNNARFFDHKAYFHENSIPTKIFATWNGCRL